MDRLRGLAGLDLATRDMSSAEGCSRLLEFAMRSNSKLVFDSHQELLTLNLATHRLFQMR